MEYLLFVYAIGAAYTCGKMWQMDANDQQTLSTNIRAAGFEPFWGYIVVALVWPFVLGMFSEISQ